jgi:hypothetical protein
MFIRSPFLYCILFDHAAVYSVAEETWIEGTDGPCCPGRPVKPLNSAQTVSPIVNLF